MIAVPDFDVKEIGLLSSVTVFFLAFYANSCYDRFMKTYTQLKQVEGQMRTICVIIRFRFHPQNPEKETEKTLQIKSDVARYKMMELLRYLGAAYYLLFAKLTDKKDHVNLENAYYDMGVITEEELRILQGHPASLC